MLDEFATEILAQKRTSKSDQVLHNLENGDTTVHFTSSILT